MMKILAINSSPRKGSTYNVIKYIEQITTTYGGVEFEIIDLKDQAISNCKGCTVCYEKHEDNCPHIDDLKDIVEKMKMADGVILASPTYVLNVSYLMKNMIDRMSYLCHRSCFYEKSAMLITTCAGQIGSKQTLKSLKMPAMSWGFCIASKLSITTGHYTPYSLCEKDKRKVQKQVYNFVKCINSKAYQKPPISALIGYRYRKIAYTHAINKGEQSEDLSYWERNGYLDKKSNYFFKLKGQKLKTALAKTITFFL